MYISEKIIFLHGVLICEVSLGQIGKPLLYGLISSAVSWNGGRSFSSVDMSIKLIRVAKERGLLYLCFILWMVESEEYIMLYWITLDVANMILTNCAWKYKNKCLCYDMDLSVNSSLQQKFKKTIKTIFITCYRREEQKNTDV